MSFWSGVRWFLLLRRDVCDGRRREVEEPLFDLARRQHFQSKRGPSTAPRAAQTPREEKKRGTSLRMTARGDALAAPASSRRFCVSAAAQKNAARMAALREMRGGWRTRSQAFVLGTACCAPTKKTPGSRPRSFYRAFAWKRAETIQLLGAPRSDDRKRKKQLPVRVVLGAFAARRAEAIPSLGDVSFLCPGSEKASASNS